MFEDKGPAYHEAGHVVAAAALGRGFQGARLAGGAASYEGGRVRCHGAEWSIPGRYRHAPIVPLAGSIAEQRYAATRGQIPVEGRADSWWDEVSRRLPEVDRRGAERLIGAAYGPLSEDEANLFLRALASRGRQLVENWWPAITVLAEELVRKRRLSRREVRHLLTPWPH